MNTAHSGYAPGFVLDHRYRFRKPLGKGGMAYVYLADDLRSGRQVAVKLMREDLPDDEEFIKRFATEARAAASLDHPNIVKVLDYGQAGEVRYIVQEYVAGTDLKKLIQENGYLDAELAVPLMIQIALGLEHAHKRGIIHRDMKPQNVLVTPDMTAKVTDFGIARASIANTITLTGNMAFGSVHYFSPEQARGSEVTEQSDLYSLGIMLYEMLTGHLPFDGESSVAVAIKQLQEMPVRPSKINPGVSVGLEAIIFKAIQKSPSRRFQSARSFVNELDRYMIDPASYEAGISPQYQNWSSSSAALTTDKGSSHFAKVDEIERNIEKQQRSKLFGTFLVTLVILLAVGAVFFLLKAALRRFSLEPQIGSAAHMIVVDRYVGRQVTDVEVELKKIYGDRYELIPVKSETQEKGVIFSQEPNYGTKLDAAEATITLKYSVGKTEIELPDLAHSKVEEAQKTLENLGLNRVLVREEASEDVEAGIVIRTDPAASSKVLEGSRVILYVSAGSQQVIMPNLEGQPWNDAERLLRETGLVLKGTNVHDYLGEKDYEDIPPAARVILKQEQAAGEEMKKGDVVVVIYGSQEEALTGVIRKPQDVDLSAFIMPDFTGKTVSEVRGMMSSRWPADAPMYMLTTTGYATDLSEEGLVVVDQSVAPGMTIDPYTTQPYIYFSRPNH